MSGTDGSSTAAAAAAAVQERWLPLLLSASYQRWERIHAAAPPGIITKLEQKEKSSLKTVAFVLNGQASALVLYGFNHALG